MIWNADLVKARFIEAADTERFLPSAKMPSASGYWPAYIYTAEDRDGWDDKAREDNAERWRGRASAGAITRHQECMDWTADFIGDEYRRKLIWGYAFCKANKRDFGKLCRRNGWARRTAYLRLNRLFSQLADELNNEGVLLQLPGNQWLAHENALDVSNHYRLGDSASAIPNTPYIVEKSRDLIKTEADVADFAEWLARRNAREAKRRQKLGLETAM